MVCDKLNKRNRVSRSTIERWIKQDRERKHWESYLRRRGKRKPKDDRRGQLPSAVSVAGRPVIAEQRGRCGDREGDTTRLSEATHVVFMNRPAGIEWHH